MPALKDVLPANEPYPAELDLAPPNAAAAPALSGRLRRALVTDSAEVTATPGELIVWLGDDVPPSCVVAPPSPRAAAAFLAASPTRLRVRLAQPLPFMQLLAEVCAAPTLRIV